MAKTRSESAELRRLREDEHRKRNWKRWGPYLAERQWGTVREDYSADGDCWGYFPFEQSASRAYRWGEDGLLGICDRECRLCFALALWNGQDEILKERLFGLTNPQGNHGEDVKELYYYLDSLPTHSYFKGLYKYPQAAFPYQRLRAENARRDLTKPEFELLDTGVFGENRYFDVLAEYAKSAPDDLLIHLTVSNRGPEAASLHLLPTLWFRNTWSWGCQTEGCWPKPLIKVQDEGMVLAHHATLGTFVLRAESTRDAIFPQWLVTENETNQQLLFSAPNPSPFVKDAFHRFVIHGDHEAVNPKGEGTKAAAYYRLDIAAGASTTIRLRLHAAQQRLPAPFGSSFARVFARRQAETDQYFEHCAPKAIPPQARAVVRQAYAGLLWSKQFYHYVLADWLHGDAAQPPPPPQRLAGRNHQWAHLYNRDVLSMPDKWEYPWFATWDLGFQTVCLADVDPNFAKQQLILFLREWYMHPNGELPAYEFNFNDANPPVHAWACWQVYQRTGRKDRLFLARAFQKLLLNFTWWVNRKDLLGNNLFSGGFLGLDNIGVLDRSRLPAGISLEQADGTAWMAFYCGTMLEMALELAQTEPEYEDLASKFFEHFVMIADAMNTVGGSGLWDENDGFYYDQVQYHGRSQVFPVRSLVGLIPLIAVQVLGCQQLERLPGFRKRMQWFLDNRPELSQHISYMERRGAKAGERYLLAIPSRPRLERVLAYLLDENEFLSPFGVRSLSKYHQQHPYVAEFDGQRWQVAYEPGESATATFGGNSNWRGPVWFPVNFLLIEALERYYGFYGEELKVECPKGSGQQMNLRQVAGEIRRRLVGLFVPSIGGQRPCHADDAAYRDDPHFRDLLLFHEYFHAETGRGLGASHQTGWTALIAPCIADLYAPGSRLSDAEGRVRINRRRGRPMAADR